MPKDAPLVSILIPVYNSEEWLASTIQSALNQTCRRKEIIIVDDGSTDQSLSVAKRFSSPIISVVSQENQGASAARNHAFSVSQGDYIQWLDADDLLHPNKIRLQLDEREHFPSAKMLFSSAWGRFRFRPHKAKFKPTELWCDLTPTEWLLRKMKQNIYMQTSTWLVSRELSEAAGSWNTRLSVDDDGEYFSRVLIASQGVRFVPEAKVLYRQTGCTAVSYIGQSKKKLESQFESLFLQIDYLCSLEQSDRVREACLQFLQDWFPYFYPEQQALVARMHGLASKLGGKLMRPQLSWKYAWIDKCFGFHSAKRAQIRYHQLKVSLHRACEKVLSKWESVEAINAWQN